MEFNIHHPEETKRPLNSRNEFIAPSNDTQSTQDDMKNLYVMMEEIKTQINEVNVKYTNIIKDVDELKKFKESVASGNQYLLKCVVELCYEKMNNLESIVDNFAKRLPAKNPIPTSTVSTSTSIVDDFAQRSPAHNRVNPLAKNSIHASTVSINTFIIDDLAKRLPAKNTIPNCQKVLNLIN